MKKTPLIVLPLVGLALVIFTLGWVNWRERAETSAQTNSVDARYDLPKSAEVVPVATASSDEDGTATANTPSKTVPPQASSWPTLPLLEQSEPNGLATPIDDFLREGEVQAFQREKLRNGQMVDAWLVEVPDHKYPLFRVTIPTGLAGDAALRQRMVAVADHLIVKQPQGISAEQFRKSLNRYGYDIRKDMLAPDHYLVAFGAQTGEDLLAAYEPRTAHLNQLASRAEPDYLIGSTAVPNDPLQPQLWGLHNAAPVATVQGGPLDGAEFDQAGSMEFAGFLPESGVTASVIDCGFGASASDFPAGVNGNIALIQRGSADSAPVPFSTKVANATNAGAVAVLLFNNTTGNINGTLGEGSWLPVITLTQADGVLLRANTPATVFLRDVSTGRDISAREAWDTHTGSRDILVGVIDTGVDYEHPDLAANMWVNPGESGLDSNNNDKATNGIDDDANGFIDDVYGWDFANDDNDPMDGNRHGTHCAGTVGAVGNNGIGVVGVNWTAKIAAIQFLTSSGSGLTSDSIDAIHYSTLIGCKVTNNSWGGGLPNQAQLEAIEDASANGALFVAAAGNSATDSPSYPASYDVENIISVAATNPNDALATFSNFGLPHVDIAAPGRDILSTVPTASGLEYDSLSGTSMASPHVAGAAVLIMSQVPGMPYLEVRQRLLDTIDPIASLSGVVATGGRLNLAAAIEGLVSEPHFETAILAVSDPAPGGDADGVANPGETVEVGIELFNSGYSEAPGVTAVFSTSDAFTTVINGNLSFGNIGRRSTIGAASPLELTFAPGTPSPHVVNGSLAVSASDGGSWSIPISLTVSDTYLLSGTVQLDGSPLAGATVAYRGETTGSVVSAGNGTFSIAVPEGNFSVEAFLSGNEFSQTPAQSLTTPGDQTGLVFAFTTATVAGIVRDDESGTPVEGATVSLIGPAVKQQETGADGAFDFTYVYGQSYDWQLTASKFAAYDLPTSPLAISTPPDQTGLELRLGFPDASLTLPGGAEGFSETIGLGQTVTRMITLENDGVAELVWAMAGQVAANSNPGTVLLSFEPPPEIGDNSPADELEGSAFDGETLYWLDGSDLRRQATDGTVGATTNLLETLIGFRSGWRLAFHDGTYLWFQEPIPDPEDDGSSFIAMHAVDPETFDIIRSVEIDASLRIDPDSDVTWSIARAQAIGGGFFWFHRGLVSATGDRILQVAKVNPLTGNVEDVIDLPVSLRWPQSNIGLMPIAYFNDRLWMIQSEQDFVLRGDYDYLYQVDPASGAILNSTLLPTDFRFVKELEVDPSGALWMFNQAETQIGVGFEVGKIDSGFRFWMASEPAAGVLDAGESVSLTVTLDASVAGEGLHHGGLRLSSNDPDSPDVFVPIVFNVTEGTPGNNAPTISGFSPASPWTMDEDTSQGFNISATDTDPDPLTYRWSLDGVETSATTNTFTYAPDFFSQGRHALAVSVDDGRGGVDTQFWQIEVTNVNRTPTANSATYTIADVDPIPFTLQANDLDGDPLTYEVLTTPSAGTLSGLEPALTYMPQAGTTGSFTLTFKVNDGEADSNTATVTFDVGQRDIAVDLTPITVSQAIGGTTNRTITIQNTGDRPLRWAAPMKPDANPIGAGSLIRTVPELPSPPTTGLDAGHGFAAKFRGLAYDNGDLLVGAIETQEDGIFDRGHVVRHDAQTGAIIGNSVPMPTGGYQDQDFMFIEKLTSTGSGIWFASDLFVNNLSSRIYNLNFDSGNLVLGHRVLQTIDDFGPINSGITWSPFGVWLGVGSASNSTQSGVYLVEAGEPGALETLAELDFDPRGPIAWANGTIWVADGSGGDMTKLNPFTGAVLQTINQPNSFDVGDWAYAEDGTFYLHENTRSTVHQIKSGDFILMSPDAGTLAGGESVTVTLTFDTNLSGPGTQTGGIHIVSNDPDEPEQIIPFTHTVTAVDGNEFPSFDSLTPALANQTISARERLDFAIEVSDPDDDPLSTNWFVNGTLEPLAEDSLEFSFVGPTEGGNHTFEVQVDDGRGAVSSFTWQVEVLPVPLAVSIAASSTSGRVPLEVDFSSAVIGGADEGGAYTFSQDLLLVEAEGFQHFVTNSVPPSFIRWFPETEETSAPFPGSVNGSIVNDTSFGLATSFAESGYVGFDIDFPSAGSYYLWMRVWAESDTKNATYVSLNGSQVGPLFDNIDDSNNYGTFRWHRHVAYFTIPSAGEHLFAIHTREPGYRVDRFIFTTDASYTPEGLGPLWTSPRDPAVSYSWNFGDGSPRPDTAEASHTFDDDGTFTSRLDIVAGEESAFDEVEIMATVIWDLWLDLKLAGRPAADRTLLANPDGDPFSNFLEYAFGLHPLIADRADVIQIVNEDDPQNFAIRYTRPRNREDLTYLPHVSNDLSTWISNEDGPKVTQTTQTTRNEDGTETITEALVDPVPEESPMFMNIEVQRSGL